MMIAVDIFLACVVIALAAARALTARALRERPKARFHRERFIALADDLVSKREIPDILAWHIVTLAHVPPGMFSRVSLKNFLKRFGAAPPHANERAGSVVRAIHGLPTGVKERYVLAMFHFSAADAYRSQIAGALWRATHQWVFEAIGEIGPDVNSHSTSEVIRQVAVVRRDRRAISASRMDACAA